MRLPRMFFLVTLLGCAGAEPARVPVEGPATLSTRGRGPRTTTRTHAPVSPEADTRNHERCTAGDLAGCHAAGLHAYYGSGDQADAEARRMFERACDAGYAPSCNGLGVLYDEGRGVDRDPHRAAELYGQACDEGVSTACLHLSQALRDDDARSSEVSRLEARYACLADPSHSDCPAR